MAALWWGSAIPWIDASGDPHVGALVEFFDSATTTPQPTYVDGSLSVVAGPSDRTANANGQFAPIFLAPDPGVYRVKITALDGTIIRDIDGVDVPQAATYVPPEAGTTDPTLLFATGMLQHWYGTTAPSGWVRGNGRTIGSATSGATERANADCQALFLHLWAADSSLAVSGGRGGTAAGDWAANKAIALPDFRGRALVGLDTMGSSAAGVLTGIDTIGETAGAESVTLDATQIPSHLHAAGTLLMPNHGHPTRVATEDGGIAKSSGGMMLRNITVNSYAAFTGSVSNTPGEQVGGSGTAAITGSTGSTGSGGSHSNVQPSKGVTIIVKL